MVTRRGSGETYSHVGVRQLRRLIVIRMVWLEWLINSLFVVEGNGKICQISFAVKRGSQEQQPLDEHDIVCRVRHPSGSHGRADHGSSR